MAPVTVGLMGFGRIGRNLFRLLYDRDDIRLGAICDRADPESLEYLLRFDTILGRFPDLVSYQDGHMYAAGRRTPLVSERDDGSVDWKEHGVDVVVEATARSRTRSVLERHLANGASRIIVCAPPVDPPDRTVVIGVNDEKLDVRDRIVSNASCTAHCVGPLLKILDETFGVERAFLSTVHAYTNQQRLADVAVEDKRRGRAAAENIIPQQTNAAHVITELMPNMEGRVEALAMNVPVANGSAVDLVCWHREPVTRESINEAVRTAAGSARYGHVLDYEEEPIVSSDILQSPFSSTFDSLATMVLNERVSKTISWFDNSWAYSHRVVDLIEYFIELDMEAA